MPADPPGTFFLLHWVSPWRIMRVVGCLQARQRNSHTKGRHMLSENLHRAGRRIVLEVFNAGSAEMLDALVGPDYVDHALPPGVAPTRDGLKSMIATMRSAFPDLEYTIEDQIAEGEKLAQRLSGRGTMQGEFMGMPPTGKSAAWEEMHILRFDPNGLLVEHWDISELTGNAGSAGPGKPTPLSPSKWTANRERTQPICVRELKWPTRPRHVAGAVSHWLAALICGLPVTGPPQSGSTQWRRRGQCQHQRLRMLALSLEPR